MIGWLRDGLDGRTLRDTLRLYLFGLTVLAPVAVVIGLAFGGQALFHATPVLVSILVLAQFGISYLLGSSASVNAHLGSAQEASASTRGLTLAFHEHSAHARPMNVFISYSSSDKRVVRSLYHLLLSVGVNPWLDVEDLVPGMNAYREIENALRASDVVLVCLSQPAMQGVGYFQKEIKCALQVASERNTFLIMVRLEECEIPGPLRDQEWINCFDDRGWEQLLHSLESHAHELGLSIEPR